MKLVLIILYTNGDHFYLKCKDLVAKGKKNNEPSVDPRGKRRRESIKRMLEINESEMDRN